VSTKHPVSEIESSDKNYRNRSMSTKPQYSQIAEVDKIKVVWMIPILQIAKAEIKMMIMLAKPCYFDIYAKPKVLVVFIGRYLTNVSRFSSLRDLESREQNVTCLVACNKTHVLLIIPSNASTIDCTYRLVRPAGLISLICAIMKA
jgi:hypothetical protein